MIFHPLRWLADKAWSWLAEKLIPGDFNDVEFDDDDDGLL